MRGERAPRKGGWDTHGLPVELEVERELGLHNKKEIEEYGVAAFNAKCRESVFRYVADWERMTERIGFWIDTDDAYVTYASEYIESCWWVFQRLWDRDLIFRDYRVTPHCPRCGTSLSSHEVALGYREDTPDPSVTVLFELSEGANADAEPALRLADGVPTAIAAWTTTPWTLPGNTALAVSAEAEYVLVEEGERRLILAADRLAAELSDSEEPAVLARVPGSALVGLAYEPLFESREWDGVDTLAFLDGRTAQVEPSEAPARRVVAADFVATDDGTGIVHIAPAFGEEDYALGLAEGLMFLEPVGLDGAFVGGPWAGQFVKDADPAIIEKLRELRLLLGPPETIRHTYPFCWRCETPILYYAKPSWYIRTTAVRDRLVGNNQQIHWVPGHIRDGRFGEWLEGNVDWALSRERYWGHAAAVLDLWRVQPHGLHRLLRGAGRAGRPRRAARGSAPPLHRRGHIRLPRLRRRDAPHARGRRRLVRLRRDALRAVALPVRERRALPRTLPGGFHLRGRRPDARLVLHAARPSPRCCTLSRRRPRASPTAT